MSDSEEDYEYEGESVSASGEQQIEFSKSKTCDMSDTTHPIEEPSDAIDLEPPANLGQSRCCLLL